MPTGASAHGLAAAVGGVAGEDGQQLVRKYSDKIRRQAGELIELEDRLERSMHYAKLCEARILQLYPGHALPITQEVLDEYESLPPPPPVDINVSQGRFPSRAKDMPAYILSAQAKHRKELVEADSKVAKLKKQVASLEGKAEEYARQLKAARATAENRDREAKLSKKRVLTLQSELEHCKSRLADCGLASDLTAVRAELEKKEEMESVRSLLRGEESAKSELEARLRVLEQALEVHASEQGLKGQASLLAEVARLRGEKVALIRDAQAKRAQATALDREVSQLREERAAMEQQEQRLRATIRELQAPPLRGLDRASAGEGSGAVDEARPPPPPADVRRQIRQLEEERDALLDYIQETADRTASLTKQVDEMSTAKQDLQAVEQALQAQMKEALSSKSAELDKLSDVQVELLAQLRESNRELERSRCMHKQASEEARVLQARSEELSREVEVKDRAHAEMQSVVSRMRARLSELEPEFTRCQAERDELRRRVDRLTESLREKQSMQEELQRSRRSQTALAQLERDLLSAGSSSSLPGIPEADTEEQGEAPAEQRHHHDAAVVEGAAGRSSGGTMGRCAQRHSCWVASAALGMLSPHLAEKVRELFTDLTCVETEASETATQAQAERREGQRSRQEWSSRLLSLEQQLHEAEHAARRAREESRVARGEVEAARRTVAAMADLEVIVSSSSDGASSSGGGDVVSRVAVLLQERQLLLERVASLEARVVTADEQRDGLHRRLEALQQEQRAALTSLRSRGEADEAVLRHESHMMRVELERATEVAERQAALSVSMEGRLGEVESERTLLHSQLSNLKAEVCESSSLLCEGLNRLLPLLKATLRHAATSSASLPPGLGEEAGLLLVEARRASASTRRGPTLAELVRLACRTLSLVTVLLRQRSGDEEDDQPVVPSSSSFSWASSGQDGVGGHSRSFVLHGTDHPSPARERGARSPLRVRAHELSVGSTGIMASTSEGGVQQLRGSSRSGREEGGGVDDYREALRRIQEKYADSGGRSSSSQGGHKRPPTATPERARGPVAATAAARTRSLSPAARKLQDRLRGVQATFAALRSSSHHQRA